MSKIINNFFCQRHMKTFYEIHIFWTIKEKTCYTPHEKIVYLDKDEISKNVMEEIMDKYAPKDCDAYAVPSPRFSRFDTPLKVILEQMRGHWPDGDIVEIGTTSALP